jgi:hypothetical protein
MNFVRGIFKRMEGVVTCTLEAVPFGGKLIGV